ncbi:unnamed protein product [Diplocarpon coronariae]
MRILNETFELSPELGTDLNESTADLLFLRDICNDSEVLLSGSDKIVDSSRGFFQNPDTPAQEANSLASARTKDFEISRSLFAH